jgi:hypothetical protein
MKQVVCDLPISPGITPEAEVGKLHTTPPAPHGVRDHANNQLSLSSFLIVLLTIMPFRMIRGRVYLVSAVFAFFPTSSYFEAIATVDSGSFYTLDVDTGMGKWIAYQVIGGRLGSCYTGSYHSSTR